MTDQAPASTPAPLTIIELQAENVKRLRAAHVRPDGSLVVVGGRNAQGKTSLLDCIEMALGGGKTIPADPVRHGSRKARIKIDLGEIVVERKFTPKGTSLSITGADGTPIASPQKLLDTLYSKVTFDPLEFTRMKATDQDRILKQLLGLDFTELDADRAKIYEARTEHNREIKRLDALLDSLPEPDGSVPGEEVSVAELVQIVDERNAVAEANEKQREKLRSDREAIATEKDSIAELDGDIAAIRERLAAKEAERQRRADQLAVAERETAEFAEKVAALVDPDVAEIKQQIATAEETNRKVREKVRRAETRELLKAAETSAEDCTAAIEAIDDQKAEQLAVAEFPVPGLGFDDTGPTLNGVPLEQASQAEKLRLSVAIGALLNPRVKVMLVREGSLLDEDGLRMLSEFAAESGSQVWLERVSSTGEGCSVVIEDGAVRESAESAAE